MGIVDEPVSGQLETALKSGLESLDRHYALTFQTYNKFTFSQDGFVFWVATGATTQARGSLHYGTDRVQEEDQVIGVNTVLFTSEEEVTAFNMVGPTTMLIATVDLGDAPIQIAFSRRGLYYPESNVWHYSGFAVYPALSAQIVQNETDLPAGPIVSNSLPLWLSAVTTFPVYPSFLIPDNAVPPYISVHIDPDLTEALGGFPISLPATPVSITNPGPYEFNSSQLAKDHVTLIFYGLNNQQIGQWFSALMDYSLNTDNIGFMNSPFPKDEKRTQVELASIAMKKRMDIEASYYMSVSDATARYIILSASVAPTVNA